MDTTSIFSAHPALADDAARAVQPAPAAQIAPQERAR